MCAASSFISEEPTPPQCPVTHFPQPFGNPDGSLHDLQLESESEGLM
jgi:hypothetical protein